MTSRFSPPDLALARVRDARSGRVSSWDQRGRNQDAWIVGPGETRVLADLEGPGAVTHMWLTQYCRRVLGPGFIDPLDTAGAAPVLEIHNALGLNWEIADPDYYRKVLLRVTYDDAPGPSILVPLGDFFGVGHSMPNSYASAFFTVSAKPEESLVFGGSASLNSYLAMPFAKRIVIEVVNEGDVALRPVLPCRLRALPAATAGRRRLPARCVAPLEPVPRLGARPADEQPRDERPEPQRRPQLRRAGDGGPGPLRGLQPLGLPPPGQLVGRGRRHDHDRRRHLAAEPPWHGHGGLLQSRLGHAEQGLSRTAARSSTKAMCRATQSATASTYPTRSASSDASVSRSSTATPTTSPTTGPPRPTGTSCRPRDRWPSSHSSERLPTRPGSEPAPEPHAPPAELAEHVGQARTAARERELRYRERHEQRTEERRERAASGGDRQPRACSRPPSSVPLTVGSHRMAEGDP